MLIGITILFALAWCGTIALRHGSAATRHAIWACAIFASLLFPLLRWRSPQHVIERPMPASIRIAAPAVAVTTGATHWDSTNLLYELWALGTAIALLRLALGASKLRRIVRTARPAAQRSPIRILTSPEICGPLVTGLLDPVILLPESSATWNASRRRAVLAHEIAHVRRCDPPILFAAHIATAVYWFHPLCWFAAMRLRIESERACDNAALRIGLRPSGYAGHLLDLARTFNPQLAIPMATTSHLESRVKSILDPFIDRSFAGRRTWLAAVLLTLAVMIPLATLSVHAQQPTTGGDIVGVVYDPSGAFVPNANLMAINTESGNQITAVSRPEGSFSFHNIPAGHYTLEVRVRGFRLFQANNLVVVNGGTAQANAALQLGAIAEAVEVWAPGTPKTQPQGQSTPVPIRIGGNVQAANLLHKVNPIYPPDLQAQGIEGTVVLAAVISKEGLPISLQVQSTSNQEFSGPAIDAVQQWRYSPVLLNGQPVEAVTTVALDFRLRR